MSRKAAYAITIVNVLFQVVYMVFGNGSTSEMGGVKYVFYLFRTEYMIVSGVIAFLTLCVLLVLIIKTLKNIYFPDVIMLLLNVEYIMYYITLMMKQ